jgi:hypothetical protein
MSLLVSDCLCRRYGATKTQNKESTPEGFAQKRLIALRATPEDEKVVQDCWIVDGLQE